METHLKGIAAKKILDVGPGYSNFGRVSAQMTGATEITYIDCNQNVLDWQTQRCKELALNCVCLRKRVDRDDVFELTEQYDLILCQEILEHVRDAEQLLSFLTRSLSDRGRIIITVPTKRSERWLKMLNPHYMEDEPFGHVHEFDAPTLRRMMHNVGLVELVFFATQPHYFVGYTWLMGLRQQIDGSTGVIISKGISVTIFSWLTRYSKRFFELTGPETWGRLLPRNYFIIAAHSGNKLELEAAG
jgi:cyclopropane fatty-acyl-phospholipid synthase-like methyltransferase